MSCHKSQPITGVETCRSQIRSSFDGTTNVIRVDLDFRMRVHISPLLRHLWRETQPFLRKNAEGRMGIELGSIGDPDTSAWMTETEFCEHFLSPMKSILRVVFVSGNVERGEMFFRCKMCAYDEMPAPPERHNICPCCGIEYGVDDSFASYDELRNDWLRNGAPWFSKVEPYVPQVDWNAWDQLDRAQYSYSVPRPESTVNTQTVSVPVPAVWVGHMITPAREIRYVN
jgi:hypothetical protein